LLHIGRWRVIRLWQGPYGGKEVIEPMNFLEMKTVVFTYVVINAVISFILFLLFKQNRKRYAGISFWLADYVLQTAGQMLIFMRGIIPDFISMVISNTLIISGILLFYLGLRRFFGVRGRQAPYYLYIPVFMALHTHFMSSLPLRSINTMAGILVFSLLCFALIFRLQDRAMRILARGTAMVFLLYSVFAAGRIALVIMVPQGNDFFRGGLYDILSIFLFQVLGIALTYVLILMINGRLILDIGSHAAEKEKAAHDLGERVKELNCLYAISSLDEQPGLSVSDIIQAAAGCIPPALQYPDHAGARIAYHDEVFTAGSAGTAVSTIGSDITEHGQTAGRVEAFYVKECPRDGADAFLEEERAMIGAIARHLGGIIEKINAEQEVRGLLREKELLLTEVHHRIKNNMASITSLLALQADDADNEATAAALTVAKNRVYAMMELYDRLYRQSQFDCLNVRDYFTSLISELRSAYDAGGAAEVTIDVDDINLGTRQVFPIGIIINELVTNAFKYAFSGMTGGALLVSLHGNDGKSVEIVVSDNGPGPRETKGAPGGFGLKLVDTLIKEAGGTYTVSHYGGTRYTITIPGSTC